MSRRPSRRPSPAGSPAPARPPAAGLAVDLVAVLLFALVGRASHAGDGAGTGLGAVVLVALPFWVGVVLAWALPRVHRDPTRLVPAGVLVLAGAVVVGAVLRLASGQGAPLPFLLVTTVVLAVLLLGWRALARLAARRAG